MLAIRCDKEPIFGQLLFTPEKQELAIIVFNYSVEQPNFLLNFQHVIFFRYIGPFREFTEEAGQGGNADMGYIPRCR